MACLPSGLAAAVIEQPCDAERGVRVAMASTQTAAGVACRALLGRWGRLRGRCCDLRSHRKPDTPAGRMCPSSRPTPRQRAWRAGTSWPSGATVQTKGTLPARTL